MCWTPLSWRRFGFRVTVYFLKCGTNSYLNICAVSISRGVCVCLCRVGGFDVVSVQSEPGNPRVNSWYEPPAAWTVGTAGNLFIPQVGIRSLCLELFQNEWKKKEAQKRQHHRKKTISNRSIMIVRWSQQYDLTGSDPDLQLPQLVWRLQLRRKYSECKVFGVVLFLLHVYLCCFSSQWAECRRQFRYLFTDQTFNKTSKILVDSSVVGLSF